MPGLYKITHNSEITQINSEMKVECSTIDSIQGYPVRDYIPSSNDSLMFDGEAWYPGPAFGGLSDIKLKENIITIQEGLNFILQLNPVSFTWKKDLEKTENFGLIAQEIKQVFNKSHAAYKEGEIWTVNYIQFIAPLIKAVQELSAKTNELESEIKILKSK